MSTTILIPTKRGANQGRLNQQQQLFLRELLADPTFNGTAAARKAGYRNPGQVANKLLKHRVIAAILGKHMREREERLQISADRVLIELARIAFVNPQDFFDKNGQPKAIEKLTPEQAAAIEEIECVVSTKSDGTTQRTYHYRLHSKISALELLGRHLSVFNDKVNHEVAGGVQLDFVSLVKQLEDHRSNVVDANMIEKIASGNG